MPGRQPRTGYLGPLICPSREKMCSSAAVLRLWFACVYGSLLSPSEFIWLFWRAQTNDVYEAKKSIHPASWVFQGDSKLCHPPCFFVWLVCSLLGQDGREFQRLPFGLHHSHSFSPQAKELLGVLSTTCVHLNSIFRTRGTGRVHGLSGSLRRKLEPGFCVLSGSHRPLPYPEVMVTPQIATYQCHLRPHIPSC